MIQPISHYLLEDIKHGLFTRQGGVSQGIYKGLNVGLGSNDDVQHFFHNRIFFIFLVFFFFVYVVFLLLKHYVLCG